MSSKVISSKGGVGVLSDDAALTTYFSITRGATDAEVKTMVEAMVCSSRGNPEKLADVFALWMHTRDIRGGKGERLIAEEMCFALLKFYPETTCKLLQMLPEKYGSWRDVNAILAKLAGLRQDKDKEFGECEDLLQKEALSLYRDRLLQDVSSEKPSLAGKWAPREKGKDSSVAKALASYCFPDSKTARKDYRKLISSLNTKLSTPEVFMCAHQWSKLEPTAIPAKCLTSQRKAFLNENIKGGGVRFPDDEDRVECSKRMRLALAPSTVPGAKKVHGAATQPHELVKEYITQLLSQPALMESVAQPDLVIEAQWKDLVERLQKDLGEGLGHLVPIADVSTDVGLLPAVVSHAILAAECAPPAFRNRVLTFSAEPKWINLENEDNEEFKDCPLLFKVRVILQDRLFSTGSSVKDLEAAVKMMLQVCQAAALPAETVSSLRLLVLSDMDFETAWSSTGLGPWSTQHEALCQQFQKAGYPDIPEIVYWSVASKSLSKGERFELPGLGKSLELELASDSSSILCGACLAYDANGKYLDTSCYTMRSAFGGALKHSGDTLIDGKINHRIGVDLKKLPENVHQLFFSLCACGPNDLSSFQRPYINLTDGATRGNLCRYDLSDAGKSPSALMAAVVKVPGGGWAITALGDDAKTRCCGDYTEMKQMCSKRIQGVTQIKPQEDEAVKSKSVFSRWWNKEDVAEGQEEEVAQEKEEEEVENGMELDGTRSLPVSSETVGVRLLCGFSADMLRCLIVSEEEKAMLAEAERKENAAAEAREAAQAMQAKAAESMNMDVDGETDAAANNEKALEEMKAAVLAANQAAEAARREAVEAKIAATSPAGKLRITLRGERYQSVRDVIAAVGEKEFKGYVVSDWVKV